MERWGEKGAAPAPGRARRYADQPSFSSTLLDAIYKSMDEPDDADAAAATKKQSQDLHYNCYYKASLAGSYRGGRAVAATTPAPGPHATTSSSSECSSYGGFSSSEAESSQHRRLRPIRTSVPAAGEAPAPAPEKTKKAAKSKPGANIRAKLRDLRKPASPGARLAGFLNAIFNGKRAPPTPPSASRTAAAAASESACSSASSYSRSCLSKTPSTRGQPKRTVRFMDSDTEAAAAAAAGTERRRVQVQVGVVELERMLLHRMEVDSDEDDDSSDASSDLFELENFAAAARPAAGGAAAYRDELPVYETTRVVLNRGIGHGHGHGHGYTHGRSTRVV